MAEYNANKNLNYFTLEVTTTQKCDMACTYCFEKDELKNTDRQTNKDEIIKKVFILLNNEVFKETYNGITLNFWGGESTLNKTLIFELMDAFADYPNIHYFFYTNGYNPFTLAEIIKYHRQYKSDDALSFQISFDGMNHDLYRVDHSGKGTHDQIINSIRLTMMAFPEINLSLKSTAQISDLEDWHQHWVYWRSLIYEFPKFSWSPTLEYTNTYEITEEKLNRITKEFLKIANEEYFYFKENRRFVLSWFNTKESAVCSAGVNISNIDLYGNVSICHGALYSDNKKDFVFGNIKDDNIITNLLTKSKELEKGLVKNNHCKACLATVCYQCPIVQYDNSKLNTFIEKLHDPKKDLCDIYIAFGKIARTLQHHIGEYK